MGKIAKQRTVIVGAYNDERSKCIVNSGERSGLVHIQDVIDLCRMDVSGIGS